MVGADFYKSRRQKVVRNHKKKPPKRVVLKNGALCVKDKSFIPRVLGTG